MAISRELLKELAKRAAAGDGLAAEGIRAYHGSPHDFDRFSTESIGTGEGAQAYGRGLYFAEREGTAQSYRDALSTTGYKSSSGKELRNMPSNYGFASLMDEMRRNNRSDEDVVKMLRSEADKDDIYPFPENKKRAKAARKLADKLEQGKIVYKSDGKVYEVNIAATPDEFIDWDLPLDEQSESVMNALKKTDWYQYAEEGAYNAAERRGDNAYGMDLVRYLEEDGAEDAAQMLKDAGIKGVQYADAQTRFGKGPKTKNYVVFDDKLIDITRKYGVGPVAAAAIAAGTMTPEEAQAGAIMTGVNLAKEVALKNLATRVNKGELSASEARALSSFVNNSVSPDTLIQGGYLNPKNMDPGQIKAATTRYIKALEDNPMLRRREGIGGARGPSSTEFYPADMNDPRTILPEDLLGEILMPNVGDTTQIGVLTKFGGYDLPEGVPSHGGPGFPQQMEELGRPYGWASNQGAANAKVAGFNKVATDTNQQPIAVVTSMGEEAQLFASPYAHAWILKAQELNMPKKQAAKFDAEVRRGVPNKDPKKKAIISPFPEWVGINHPDAKAQLLGGPSPTREGVTYPSVGGRRKSVLLTANKNVEWRNSGLPSLGDLHKGLQINPNETAFEVGRSGYSMYTPEIGVPTEPIDFHQAYDTGVRGKYKGQIEGVTVPGRVMFPDIVKAYTDRGKTEAMAIGAFMANPNIYQKANQQWLDGIRDYLDNLPPVDRDNVIKALPALGVTSTGLAALGIAFAPQEAQASAPQDQQASEYPSLGGMGVRMPPTAQGGGLVPFDPAIHTPQDVGLGEPGSVSTEYIATVDAPDGSVMLIPTIWWDAEGNPKLFKREDTDKAIELAIDYEQSTGKQFPRFPAGAYAEADDYAISRSKAGGASQTPLAQDTTTGMGGMGVRMPPTTQDEEAMLAAQPPAPTGADLLRQANDEFASGIMTEPSSYLDNVEQALLGGIMQTAGMADLAADVFSSLAAPLLSAPGAIGRYAADRYIPGVNYSAEDIARERKATEDYFNYQPRTDLGPQYGEQIMQGIGGFIGPYIPAIKEAADDSYILGAMRKGYDYLGAKEKELAKAMLDLSPI